MYSSITEYLGEETESESPRRGLSESPKGRSLRSSVGFAEFPISDLASKGRSVRSSVGLSETPRQHSVEPYMTKTSDPKVWGPPFWFSLHVSAVYYPMQASPLVRERMKQRILAIPYEIPCGVCRPHASAFVEKHKDNLDNIVSGRHSLGKFYVDFHNQVNKRYGKPEWSYEQAYKVYSGNTK